MYRISLSETFRTICPLFTGAAIEATVTNPPASKDLWEEIEARVAELRNTYDTTTIKERPGIAATRLAYKAAGKDPSRYRPACEQLARRVLQGKELYSVNTLVDIGNLVSLVCGYSTAALDADKIAGHDLTLGLGRENEPYEGIGRGLLNIENLPVYRDAEAAFATPTSDSTRTMITPETTRFLMLINGYDGNKAEVEAAIQLTEDLLRRHSCAENIRHIYY